MNRRKAKKAVKRKYRITRWHGNEVPRDVARLHSAFEKYSAAIRSMNNAADAMRRSAVAANKMAAAFNKLSSLKKEESVNEQS